MIGLLMLAAATITPVTFLHGNDLDGACRGADVEPCTFYVVGAYDTIDLSQQAKLTRKYICLQPNVNISQMTDVFMKYIRDHPEKRHLLGTTLVSMSLEEALPVP